MEEGGDFFMILEGRTRVNWLKLCMKLEGECRIVFERGISVEL